MEQTIIEPTEDQDREEKQHLSIPAMNMLKFLLDHPEGKQKTDFRNELDLSPNTAVKSQKQLFEDHLIEPIPSYDKHLFGLTEDGKYIAYMLKTIDIIFSKVHNPDYRLNDNERVIIEKVRDLSKDFLKKQDAIRAASAMNHLIND